MRSTRNWRLVAVIALAAACGGSSKKPTPEVAKPADPIEQPAEVAPVEQPLPAISGSAVAAPDGLAAVAQVADVRALIASVGKFADGVQPGVSAMVTLDSLLMGAAQEGIDLSGVDFGKPVRVLWLNPSKYQLPFVAVVGVKDEAALTAAVKSEAAASAGLRIQIHQGYAAIGSFETLSAAGGYALTTLAASAPPANPTVDIDVKYLVAAYQPFLEMIAQQASVAADPSQKAMMEATMTAYMSMFRQIDKASLSLELVGDHASLVTSVRPLDGTTFASFVGAQKPSQFALIGRVPAGPITMGGYMDFAQVWSVFGELMKPMMAQMYGDATPAVMKFWDQWVALKTGESAISIDLSSSSFGMSGLWDVDNAAAAAKMWTEYFTALVKTPIATMTVKTGTVTQKGVKISTAKFSPGANMPPEQKVFYDQMGGSFSGGFAAIGKQLVFAFGTDATAGAKKMVDVAKAKPTAPRATLATVIADAKQRGESYLVAFDLAAIKDRFAPAPATGNGPGPKSAGTAEPGAFALGVAGGALQMRLTLPAAQVKLLAFGN